MRYFAFYCVPVDMQNLVRERNALPVLPILHRPILEAPFQLARSLVVPGESDHGREAQRVAGLPIRRSPAPTSSPPGRRDVRLHFLQGAVPRDARLASGVVVHQDLLVLQSDALRRVPPAQGKQPRQGVHGTAVEPEVAARPLPPYGQE
ncbi:unnamed protein product [Clonostachys byssicola]|uniref:Uncharacterized protein n=1 Tax=Clonostachys byssicola TaxID=160290 RepID=A0A9N9UBZ9_9HYPO|nr:unnamed protein product [Clonostachys byssicola]